MAYEILKNYINHTYPHLTFLLTEKQYEQIDWIDTSYQTNERVPTIENEPKIHLHQQRIFARLHFLFLLRQGEDASYHRFVNGQKEPKLTSTHFAELSQTIKQLSAAEYKQLWVATLTSKSTEANKRAAEALKENPPFDAVDFLAKVMTQIPEIYPAAAELLTQDHDAKAGFATMFDTGHFRHMMYVEGGPTMFRKLRDKIQNKMQKKELNLWFAYWLIDITGFRAQTKELGSEYFNDNTYKAVTVLKSHLDKFFEEPQRAILYDYLNDRAKWLGLGETSSNSNAFLSANNPEIPRLILARIAAMQRLFTSEEKVGLQRGMSRLMEKLGDENYKKLLEILNPLQVTEEPTPTFGPALLANLREENKIEKTMPLNLNGLAGSDNIKALLEGEEFLVSVNPSDGTSKLQSVILEHKLDVPNTHNTRATTF